MSCFLVTWKKTEGTLKSPLRIRTKVKIKDANHGDSNVRHQDQYVWFISVSHFIKRSLLSMPLLQDYLCFRRKAALSQSETRARATSASESIRLETDHKRCMTSTPRPPDRCEYDMRENSDLIFSHCSINKYLFLLNTVLKSWNPHFCGSNFNHAMMFVRNKKKCKQRA